MPGGIWSIQDYAGLSHNALNINGVLYTLKGCQAPSREEVLEVEAHKGRLAKHCGGCAPLRPLRCIGACVWEPFLANYGHICPILTNC